MEEDKGKIDKLIEQMELMNVLLSNKINKKRIKNHLKKNHLRLKENGFML